MRIAFRLLRFFCSPELLEEIEGDLIQKFDRYKSQRTNSKRDINAFYEESAASPEGALYQNTGRSPVFKRSTINQALKGRNKIE